MYVQLLIWFCILYFCIYCASDSFFSKVVGINSLNLLVVVEVTMIVTMANTSINQNGIQSERYIPIKKTKKNISGAYV